jgi:hypothetical protein
MIQYTHNLFELDRIWKQAKLILIRLLIFLFYFIVVGGAMYFEAMHIIVYPYATHVIQGPRLTFCA